MKVSPWHFFESLLECIGLQRVIWRSVDLFGLAGF
jgi:hypothetical protein